MKMSTEKIKKGPCGGKGQPKCADEWNKMVGLNKNLTNSYRNELTNNSKAYINTSLARDSKTQKKVNPSNISKGVGSITTKRIKEYKDHPVYKKLTENKLAKRGGIIRTIDKIVRKTERGYDSQGRYQIPSIKSKNVKNIIKKVSPHMDSENPVSEIGLLGKGSIALSGARVLKNFPNLLGMKEVDKALSQNVLTSGFRLKKGEKWSNRIKNK